VWPLPQRHAHVATRAFVRDRQVDRFARPLGPEKAVQIIAGRDRLTVRRHNDAPADEQPGVAGDRRHGAPANDGPE